MCDVAWPLPLPHGAVLEEKGMSELPFECGVLLIYVRQPHKRAPWGATLKDPGLVRIADRGFVTGEMLDTGNNWFEGRRCQIAVDEIVSMFSFDSEEDYHARTDGKSSRRRKSRSFLR